MSYVEYILMENDSKVFLTGSIWTSNKAGDFKIIGKINKIKSKLPRNYKKALYLIEFADGTRTHAQANAINGGSISNLNIRKHYGVGYFGYGPHSSRKNGKLRREYYIWHDMLRRCYSTSKKDRARYSTYNDIEVDARWHSFQNFCSDFKKLEGYSEWLHDSNFQLDKDTRIPGSPFYSKDTCVLLHNSLNTEFSQVLGIKFKATRLSDNYTEIFMNKRDFMRRYGICRKTIQKSIDNQKPYGGWLYEVIDE